MKNTRILRAGGAALLSTALLLTLAPAGRAADYIYPVTLNTASLLGNPNAPFALDLELITGSNTAGHGNVTNTVTLSNFSFVGGTVDSGSIFTMGGVTGSVGSSITLTNSSQDNIFAINFSTMPTSIQFTVDQTNNSEVVTTGTAIPDQFSVYLDDFNQSSGFVPTDAIGGTNTLITSPLISGSNLVIANNSVSPDAGVIAVPEPGSAALLLVGVVGLVARRKRLAAAQTA